MSLAGNEQFLAIPDRHDVLVATANEWATAGTVAVERPPAYQRLEALLRHAESLDVAQEVLESVERISLDDWRTRTAALPQWFGEARAEADRFVEPTTRHLKLETATLRTSEDVKTWARQIEQRLLEAVEHGPIVID